MLLLASSSQLLQMTKSYKLLSTKKYCWIHIYVYLYIYTYRYTYKHIYIYIYIIDKKEEWGIYRKIFFI